MLRPTVPLALLVVSITVAAVVALLRSDLQADTVDLALVGGSALVSPHALAAIRGACAAIGLLTLSCAVLDPVGVRLSVTYLPGSSLVAKPIHVSGLGRLSTFTVQSWALLTLYFACAAACSASLAAGAAAAPPRGALVALWFVYEASLAGSALVTTVTTFVLIPKLIEEGKADAIDIFFGWKAACMHNLNLLFMATEACLNNMPVLAAHLPVATLWGLWYVFFSWAWLRYGAYNIVYYFFLDPVSL